MIRSDNRHRLLAALAWLAAAGTPARGDNLLFAGDQRMSGSVRTLTPDGTLVLESPLSPDPVAIRTDGLRKVTFGAAGGDEPAEGTCLLTLANGDSLPGTVGEVNGEAVNLATAAIGPLAVPRAAVASIQPGLEHPTMVYSGPDGLAGWKIGADSDERWAGDKDSLTIEGRGIISRKVELPESFIVRFKIVWRNSPNLDFSFAAEQVGDVEAQNRYRFQFNSAGMQIRRESTGDKRWTVITSLSRLPTQFDGKSVLVEIRVDRAERQLQLWLNGELEAKYQDPVPPAPAGGFLAFASNAGDKERQTLSEIQVLDWNLKTDRRPVGERGDKTRDLLIGVDGERFSGNLLQTRPSDEGLLYVFKTAFQEQAIEVPESLISSIHLAGEASAGADAKTDFILKLRGGGSLQVSECAFSPDDVTVRHPLLGELTLKRAAVSELERKAPATKDNQES
jgi:hypothetical protein